MDSLVGYGSDDEYESENSRNNHGQQYQRVEERDMARQHQATAPAQRYDDGTNYDDVTMDMSEDSSENDSDGGDDKEEDEEERNRYERSSSRSSDTNNTTYSDERKDHGNNRGNERETYKERGHSPSSLVPVRRGLLGDRPGDPNANLPVYNSHGGSSAQNNSNNNKDERCTNNKPMALMDVKPFADQHHPLQSEHPNRYDKDSVDRRDRDYDRDNDRDKKYGKDRHNSDRDKDRDRYNDRDKDRDRHTSDRDRDRYTSDRDKRHYRRRSRSRSRDRGSRRRSHSRERDRRNYYRGDSRRSSDSPDKRNHRSNSRSPSNAEYRTSYKVSKKLHAMEKMGLQIKTPDGSMATAQMLMQKTLDDQVEKVKNATGIELPKYYNPAIMNPHKYAEQMQKKKMLWGNKSKEPEPSGPSAPTEPPTSKANQVNKWQGAKFAQDNDGKVASKFLRLMGVKDPNATTTPQQAPGEIVKKQEEMFEAMQAQYDVARATTHTMRGVGLGFSNSHRHF